MNDEKAVALEARKPLRRNLLLGAMAGMGAAIMTALGLPAVLYLFSSPKSGKPSEWTEAGDIANISPNTPVEIAFHRKRVDGWKIVSEKTTAWVVKHTDNTVTAFGPQCTHLGCAYHWTETANEFLCPCHTSVFSIDGKVISGPAPRPLDRYDTKIEAGKLFIGRLRPSVETQG
ncbi:MAG: ubiquinol-cytochrome c reductase iron-sulfur subunit [Bryobacteraceae bacterium]